MGRRWAAAGLVLAGGVAAIGLAGCEVSSSEDTDASVVREVGVDYSGFYDANTGSDTNTQFVTPANSGQRVTSFNLRQNGDQLEAIDNNNIVFRGTIGNVVDSDSAKQASFTLEGQTTAGQEVTVAGTLAGSGTSATMTGTWIEPNLYAYVNGDATINQISTNKSGGLTLSPTSGTVSTNGGSITFSVSGGSGSYSWSVSSSSLGSVSPTTGDTTVYTRSASGDNTVTVSDSYGSSKSATVSQP